MQLVLANICEPFLPLLNRDAPAGEGDFQRRVDHEHSLADRATFWCADNKILITPQESRTCTFARRAGVYQSVTNLWPKVASPSLCDDIRRDHDVLVEIVSLCGNQPVDLRAYAVTDQLVKLASVLMERGVRLRTPEFSVGGGQAVGRHFDTKSGFRQLMSNWFSDDSNVRIPEGNIAETKQDAVIAAMKFLDEGKPCIIKPDCGESGLGLIWLYPDQKPSRSTLAEMIASNASFGSDPIIVEERISPSEQPDVPTTCSPSVEVEIDTAGPKVTYICDQIVSEKGEFRGIRIGLGAIEAPLRRLLAEIGLKVGARLHSLGYRGFFDLDFAMNKDGHPSALEANTRRTGGTHAHDLATHLVGRNYADHRTVVSNDALGTNAGLIEIENNSLNQTGDDLWLPSVLATVGRGSVGYVAIARSTDFIRRVEQMLGGREQA